MAELIDTATASNHTNLGPISSDITPFHSRAVPSISVHDYLARIAKFVCLENDSLLAVLFYLDRITRNHLHRPALAISPFNIHRLLITAIVVAHKFNSDIFFNNARYSKFDLKIDHDQLQQVGKWLMTCPRADLCDSQRSTGQPISICVLETYYRDLDIAAKQAELCHIHYPTPLMDPTPIRSSGSVSYLDLNGSATAATANTTANTNATAATTSFQQPVFTAIHRLPHYNHNQNPHNLLHQPKHQHYHQNPYSCAPQQITTPSSIDTSSSLGLAGSSSFVAPSCPSATSTLCHGFGGPEIDHGSWRGAAAFSPASPENQMFSGSLVGTSNDNSLKRRKFPAIGYSLSTANVPSALASAKQDVAAPGVFIIDND
ncbi:cyclin-like protein interacting with PHO85 [Coemansia erecta]|nr:cyclin-like protein interacting with PHO85 [Coemansia erecta]